MINLLITTAGGSGIYAFLEAIKTSKYNINLTLIDANELAGGLYEVSKSYVVPSVYDEHYLCVLKEIFEKENINYFISLLDEELLFLSDKNISPKHLIPSKDSLMKAWDKRETYKTLKSFMPKTVILTNDLNLKKIYSEFQTILLKPPLSRGGRRIIIPEDFEEFEFFAKRFLKKKIPYLVQELVHGKEYNITTLHDKKGNLIYAVPRWKFEKRIIKSGSKASVIVDNEKVVKFALAILKKLNLNYGFNNVEVIENENGIYLLEVNAGRIAAQDMNIVKAGINIIDLFIDIANDKRIGKIDYKRNICNLKIAKDIYVEFDVIKNKLKDMNEIINSCCSS
jgi:carbamoyl-phosphate synthase large subunit